MPMDAIRVHVEKGGEHGKIKGNTPLEINDYLRTMHENWCRVQPPLHSINDHKRDKVCKVMERRTA